MIYDQQRPRADTAVQALACLEELALETGLDDVSMRDVARRLGISLAALQYHYATKAALLDAFVAHAIAEYRARLAAIAAANVNAPRYGVAIRFMVSETRRIGESGVLAMIQARAFHDPAAKRATQSFMMAYLSTLSDMIAAEFPGLSPEETNRAATLVCSLLEGLASTLDASRARGVDEAQVVEATIHIASVIPELVGSSDASFRRFV
ncbi:TetR/AcrR family transcriptional regulator [Brevundimonas sp. AJA228-03]|uniref:TetR/AcrR family transcriptional regulator n=1 Tax=Brevundimonas sp. AJA228-03 TaxID=2752515 RepID=UPI001ADF48A6|nr:TetR/AcrR family transcriptional regulator [Brevundimonas sp. AJA228-03]QTN19285.1 TetR/AcrR family transcriptional regulator [Brevundimonas sp. AJA228-03]